MRTLGILDKLALFFLTKGRLKSLETFLVSLMKTEFIEREGLEEIQNRKLANLLEEAKNNVPYFTGIMRNLGNIGSNKSPLSSLSDFPVLSKFIVKTEQEAMWSRKSYKLVVSTTGGTTGTPLIVRKNIESHRIAEAALWRARMSWGILPSDRLVFLRSVASRSIRGGIRMFLANKRITEAFPVTKEEKLLVSSLFKSFKPKAIEGYSTGLLNTISSDHKRSEVQIPVIIATGEMLYEHQREELESYYSGKLFSYYGSNEIGSIAFKCAAGNFHICEEHVIVEVLDENNDVLFDSPGKIVVTDLDNVAMPFIRYEIGDIGVITKDKCNCGRSSRVLKELHGRSQDFLPGRDEKRLQATQLAAYLKDINKMGDLQFQYSDDGRIVVLYTGEKEEARKEFDFITSYLISKLGDVEIKFEFVQEIVKSSRGKKLLIKKI